MKDHMDEAWFEEWAKAMTWALAIDAMPPPSRVDLSWSQGFASARWNYHFYG